MSNSLSQDYTHLDDHNLPVYDITAWVQTIYSNTYHDIFKIISSGTTHFLKSLHPDQMTFSACRLIFPSHEGAEGIKSALGFPLVLAGVGFNVLAMTSGAKFGLEVEV